MPWINIWAHFVWSTKDRVPFLTDDIRYRVFDHIRTNAREKSIHLDFINGYVEHVHCLISLGHQYSISKMMQLLKGESSNWINKQGLTRQHFSWQDEYFAVGVAEDRLPSVRRYILNQEKHHGIKSFDEEFEDLLIRGGFKKFNDKDGSVILS